MLYYKYGNVTVGFYSLNKKYFGRRLIMMVYKKPIGAQMVYTLLRYLCPAFFSLLVFEI